MAAPENISVRPSSPLIAEGQTSSVSAASSGVVDVKQKSALASLALSSHAAHRRDSASISQRSVHFDDEPNTEHAQLYKTIFKNHETDTALRIDNINNVTAAVDYIKTRLAPIEIEDLDNSLLKALDSDSLKKQIAYALAYALNSSAYAVQENFSHNFLNSFTKDQLTNLKTALFSVGLELTMGLNNGRGSYDNAYQVIHIAKLISYIDRRLADNVY